MKKKFFSLVILLGVLSTLFVGTVGCKDKDKDKSSSSAKTSSTTQENGATTSSSKK